MSRVNHTSIYGFTKGSTGQNHPSTQVMKRRRYNAKMVSPVQTVCYHLSYKIIMGAGGSAGGGVARIGIGIHSGSVEKARASGVHFTSRRMIFCIQNVL